MRSAPQEIRQRSVVLRLKDFCGFPLQALLLLLCCTIATSDAFARRAAAVAIVRADGDAAQKAASFVAHFFRKELRADSRYRLVDVARSLGDPKAETAATALKLADEELLKAKRLFEDMDLDEVVDSLNSALGRFENHVAYLENVAPVAQALLFLGGVHLLRGEPATGIKRVKQALSIDPALINTLDPQVFTPENRKIVKKAAQELQQRARGTLSIGSTPSFAEVFVDGRFVGVTPLELDDVLMGKHYVRLQKDGMRNAGKVLKVARAARRQPIEMRAASNYDEFDRLSEELIAVLGGTEEDAVDPVVGMGTRLGEVDYMLAAGVQLDGERIEVTAVMYDLDDGNRVIRRGKQVFSYESGPETYRGEIADMYKRFFGQTPTDPTALIGERGRGVDPNASVCLGMSCGRFKTMLWGGGLLGGGAMMGLGSLFWGLSKADNNAFRAAFQVSGEAANLEQSGKAKAVAGDILFFVGASALVTAGLLYYFYVPAPSAGDVLGAGQGRFGLSVAPTNGGVAIGATLSY